jgi:hypothetical protein
LVYADDVNAMIMDIKTMDMFDDPKGKTITINVSE